MAPKTPSLDLQNISDLFLDQGFESPINASQGGDFSVSPSQQVINPEGLETPGDEAIGTAQAAGAGKNRKNKGQIGPGLLERIMGEGSIFSEDQEDDPVSGEARSVINNVGERQNVFATLGMLNFLDDFGGGATKGKSGKILESLFPKEDKGGGGKDKEEDPASTRNDAFNSLPEGFQRLIGEIPKLRAAFEGGKFDGGIVDPVAKQAKSKSGRK